MNYFPLTRTQQEWQERTADLAAHEIGPHAADYDRQAQYPEASLEALREAGL
jgi:alkylation response protein AidB-like acyl-CoA dehydrogenase